jgi:hypothetical protein
MDEGDRASSQGVGRCSGRENRICATGARRAPERSAANRIESEDRHQ